MKTATASNGATNPSLTPLLLTNAPLTSANISNAPDLALANPAKLPSLVGNKGEETSRMVIGGRGFDSAG